MSEITETFINSSNGVNSFDVQQSTGVTTNNNQPVTKVNSRTGGLDTVLTEEQIAQLGFIKVDTNTQLTDAQIEALGYVKTDTNTQLSDADILALGYRKIDPDFIPNIGNQTSSVNEGEILNYNIVNSGVPVDQIRSLNLPAWMEIETVGAGHKITGTAPSYEGNANDVLTIAFKASTMEGGSVSFNITNTIVEVLYTNEYSLAFDGRTVGFDGPNSVTGSPTALGAFSDPFGDPWAMSFWFKPTISGDTSQTLFYTGKSTITNSNAACYIKTTGSAGSYSVEAFIGNNLNNQSISTGTGVLSSGWNLIFIQFNPSMEDFDLFINNVDVGFGNTTTVGSGGNGANLGQDELRWMSGVSDADGSTGRLNQIAIWTPQFFNSIQRAALYNSGDAQDLSIFSPLPSQLYEPENNNSSTFNRIIGNTFQDLSISGIDALGDIVQDSPAP
mgnify:CR=1 FL=1